MMTQPSTSAQVRAVALREAAASVLPPDDAGVTWTEFCNRLNNQEAYIIGRAERFADYIENGVQQDA